MKKILFYCSIVIGLCVIFVMNLNSVIDRIEEEAIDQEVQINQFVSRIDNISDTLTVYAESYFENGSSYDDEYIEYFAYDEELEMYILDYPGTAPYDGVGLTGLEEIPADGLARQELNMALSLGDLFYLYYQAVPGISWLFYTSESGYMALYPWTSTDEFVFTVNEYSEYYTAASPENNPYGLKVWGPLYEDEAGKGYLFTLSQPVYYNDDFLGVISVEFSNEVFDEHFITDYNCYLVNEYDQILGSNDEEVPEGIVTLNDYLGVTFEKIESEVVAGGSNGFVENGQYMYTINVATDYFSGLMVVPISEILGEALLSTLIVALLVLVVIVIYTAFENRKKRLNELARMTITDPLTGAYNRRKFEESIYEKMEKETFEEFHVAVLDLDYFKTVNDTYGHDAGDQVLKTFVRLLQKNLDEYVDDRMIYARIGGEEFGIIFKDFKDKEVVDICETLRENVAAHHFEIDFNVTISMGVTKVTSENSFIQSFKNADDMLYEAKQAGRNKVIFDM